MKLASFLKHYGPGIIMASSCVGGSHIIASTQAGAYFGWQLAGLIVGVNLLKYPFFRLAFDYSSLNGQNVLHGYAQRGRAYLVVFLLFNLFATVVNIAGGTLLSAALLRLMLPESVPITWLNVAVLLSFVVLLFGDGYRKLDNISKAIMLLLTVITLLALVLAADMPHTQTVYPLNAPNPWTWASVPFLAALMGWMPAPMELSVSSSMWVVEKMRQHPSYREAYRRDFVVSYTLTIVLALMFMALGAWVLFGHTPTGLKGGEFVGQFVNMYAQSIGQWMRLPMALMAFACIYGTTLVAVDGYSRGNQHAWALLHAPNNALPDYGKQSLRLWTLAALLASWGVLQFFDNAVGKMVAFAMTASFVSAPVFAWLNWGLRHQCGHQPKWFQSLAWLGLIYLLLCVLVYFQAA